MSIVEIKKSRKEKLKSFEKEGINPYPLKTKRSFPIERALTNFNLLSKSGKSFFLAGRIRSVRSHGGSTFIHFEDGTGRIQAFFRKNKESKLFLEKIRLAKKDIFFS